MDSLERLVSLFRLLPGIGPRQARRFVYFLLRQENGLAPKLAVELSKLKNLTSECADCGRFFAPEKTKLSQERCAWCANPVRELETIMIVEKEADLDNIKLSGAYNGRFFVLGMLASPLRPGSEKVLRPRLDLLIKQLTKPAVNEIIFALAASPDGDHTTEQIQKFLQPVIDKQKIKTTVLGRGLSTGTELEYSDGETLKHAIRHREHSI